jgi:NAD(P)H-dependent flavin oxidoreductase YrpB (nitropropane dioxygenase family)
MSTTSPSGKPARPRRTRWTSFIATADTPGEKLRQLQEEANPRHRLRVEHNKDTLLVHLSDEDGAGWTTIAVDRATRSWAVAQGLRQADAAAQSYDALYGR